MAALALVLLVRGAGAGYGEAGLVAAAYAVAVAIGAPYGGRQVDRRGARLVLRRRMVLFPSLFGLVAVLGEIDAPIAAIAVVAAAAGLTLAPVSSVLRSIWPDGRGRRRREDGVRPRRRAAGADLRRRAAARRRSWPCSTRRRRGGVRPYSRRRDVRLRADPARPRRRAGRRAAQRRGSAPSPRSACARSRCSALCLGLGFGSVEIAVPAFAEAEGNRALAGIALAGFSAGSLVGGLVAGLRPSSDERRRIVIGTFALTALMALPLAADVDRDDDRPPLLCRAPDRAVVAAVYGQIGRVAAAGSVAEAFSWFGTAVSIGIAGGSVLGGGLIDGEAGAGAIAARHRLRRSGHPS